MKLYLVRHGKADWPGWERPDDERPLTANGHRQVRRVAKLLRRLKVEPTVILTSPLPRARQTAESIAERLGVELRDEPVLGKGFALPALRALLTRTLAPELMVVGHEPDFSAVIRQLTGARVKLGKAAVARIDLAAPESDGTLVWLLQAAIAKQL